MPILESLLLRGVWEVGRQITGAVPRGFNVYRFGKFFGKPAQTGKGVCVVLDPYEHPQQSRAHNRYIKRMLGRGADLPVIGEDIVLGTNAVRVIGYFSGLFIRDSSAHRPVAFELDTSIAGEWERTFFCVGSPDTNVKTYDVFHLPEQKFVTHEFGANGQRVWRAGGTDFGFLPGKDRGVLLKMRNPRFPQHWLVVCAGLGEWGSTGVIWFLTNKWRELYARFGGKNFCMVVEVTPGIDQSAHEIASWS
jgi:hypothetical protein